MPNLPIFRAKKKDSDTYVEGFLIDKSSIFILNYKASTQMGSKQFRENIDYFKIDPTTIAIHFPDMIDSQGNKIFASLNIKGGSLIDYEEKIFEAMYLNGLIQGVKNMDSIQKNLFKYSKIIGIKE